MQRCVALATVWLACAAPAAAQAPRSFSAAALRGEIVITQPPELLLNQQPARLAPGARIRGADNMLHLSGELVGQRLRVNYTLDPSGLLLDLWLLTADEAARQPWPRTLDEARSWRFDPPSQTWSRP
jgi:hypothetical protein